MLAQHTSDKRHGRIRPEFFNPVDFFAVHKCQDARDEIRATLSSVAIMSRRTQKLTGLRCVAVALVVVAHAERMAACGYSGWLTPLRLLY